MGKDKHTPSLEHSRLLIQERINYLKPYIAHLELCRVSKEVITNMAILKQELAGHEQGLKACNNHYALLEALKALDPHNTGNGPSMDWQVYYKAIKNARDLIKQCEG